MKAENEKALSLGVILMLWKRRLMSKIYFLHGVTGSKNNFIYLQKYFPGSVAFDLPGFGEEAKPDEGEYDKDFFLAFLETKIKERCTLVGHSMGSILAKDFALVHPQLVERLFLISYPVQKDAATLEKIVVADPMTKALLSTGPQAEVAAKRDAASRFVFLPLAFIFWNKYYATARDYYRHTQISLARSVRNTVFKDNYKGLYELKNKVVMIAGERDRDIDQSLLKDFELHVIPKMKHQFFRYEDQIAGIIKGRMKNEE